MIKLLKAIGDKCYALAGKLEIFDVNLLKYCGISLGVGVVMGYLLK